MHRGSQTLRADVDMHNYALRFPRGAGVAVGHGERDHFVRTCDHGGELSLFLELAFADGFDNRRVVGAEVDKAVADAKFPEGFEEGITGCVPGGFFSGY